MPQRPPGPEGTGTLVLVVEDNPLNLELIEAVLEREGYHVVSAGSGEEAEEWLGRLHPDLVLLDIGLPGMSGLELARRIKADPRTADIPLVALSAHALPEDRAAALEAGCVDYLSKPVDTRALPAQLARVLGRRPPES